MILFFIWLALRPNKLKEVLIKSDPSDFTAPLSLPAPAVFGSRIIPLPASSPEFVRASKVAATTLFLRSSIKLWISLRHSRPVAEYNSTCQND